MPRPPKRNASRRARASSRRPAPGPAGLERRWHPPSRDDLLFLGIALLAVLVRLPHLGWGLPDVQEEALPMKKAFAMWGWDRGRIDWNPHTAGWPSLSFYVQLLIQHLHYAWGHLRGVYADRGDFFVAHWLDPGPVLLLARGVSVGATALLAWLGARVAQRLAGRGAAIVTGVLIAIAPLLVEYGQLVTPDVLVAAFTALAVDRILRIATRDRRSDDVWAGLWIGLGISSKYTPILLVPGLLAAYGLRLGSRAFRSSRPWIALAVAFAAFAATSPFLLLDASTFLRDVTQQETHMTSGHFGSEPSGPGVLAYLIRVLGPGLGWSGLALASAGLVWGVARGRREWRALVFCILPYYVGLSLLRTQFPRYMLPLIAPIAVGIAGAWEAARSLAMPPRLRAVASALLVVAIWAPAGVGTWRYHELQGRPSTQSLANHFVREANRASAVHVAAEVLSLTLPTARAAEVASQDAVLSEAQRRRLTLQTSYDVDYLPMYTVQPEEAARYYDLRHFTAHDYVIVTNAVRARYLADTARFATEARFYRDLDRFTSRVARFSSASRARGPEIDVYRVPLDLADRLEAERGPLLLPALDRASRVHGEDYLAFVEGVARAAYVKGRWAQAARYYTAMLQAGELGWMNEVERLPLMRMLGLLRERTGESAEAARLYEAYLALVPGDSEVRAALERVRGGARGGERPARP